MELLIYFFTVFLPGLAFLAVMWKRDNQQIPVGENFMPTLDEIKDFL